MVFWACGHSPPSPSSTEGGDRLIRTPMHTRIQQLDTMFNRCWHLSMATLISTWTLMPISESVAGGGRGGLAVPVRSQASAATTPRAPRLRRVGAREDRHIPAPLWNRLRAVFGCLYRLRKEMLIYFIF